MELCREVMREWFGDWWLAVVLLTLQCAWLVYVFGWLVG